MSGFPIAPRRSRRITAWLAILSAAWPTTLSAQWKTSWTYEGAAHWSELDTAYAACNAGKEQSPIDIRGTTRANLPPVRFAYTSGPLNYLINNGHTIRVNFHEAPGSGNALFVGDKRYDLTQFHFHRPSEERINGRSYDMVVHLMHQSSDGAVVGVAVFLTAGRSNPTVQRIWDRMPRSTGPETNEPGVAVNPHDLVPLDGSYYAYQGSLTAPPCTEGVTWFVMKTPVEVSRDQIKAFAALYPSNVRPLQPLNGRVVREASRE
jgi:carbonic anhydrase